MNGRSLPDAPGTIQVGHPPEDRRSATREQETPATALAARNAIAPPGGRFDDCLLLGTNFLYVDTAGKLRLKATAPTADGDGTVVGTQV